ncbi:MAG TPA: cytochrome biogenesis protein, partial [Shewanella frigidimarina]|nr:cytochrome biogenesis protein [Shewanella frigidimarina]
ANIPTNGQTRLGTQLTFLCGYNFGRIFSYTVAGAIVGGSVSALGHLFDVD